MKVYDIDLYEYFGVKKPENGAGTLTCYILDNSREVNPERKKPAMLVIPGGGYGMTSFREEEPVAVKYLSYGYNAFMLEYSVAPVRHPYQLAEAVMAMNYIRLTAGETGTDPAMVAAVGFSAGGHLCAMLGSIFDSEDIKPVFTPSVSARPDAVILSYPVITYGEKSHNGSFDNLCGDNEELKKSLAADKLVNKNSSPAFIWATRNDGCVPVRSSLAIAAAYEENELNFSIHVFGQGWHGLSLADKTVYGAIYDEVEKQLSTDVSYWVDMSVNWLKEQGIFVKD